MGRRQRWASWTRTWGCRRFWQEIDYWQDLNSLPLLAWPHCRACVPNIALPALALDSTGSLSGHPKWCEAPFPSILFAVAAASSRPATAAQQQEASAAVVLAENSFDELCQSLRDVQL